MVKFIDASQTTTSFESLLQKTNEFLFILTPFIQLPDKIKNNFVSLIQNNVKINIVLKSPRINQYDVNFFRDNSNINIYYCDNLHAKCYINDNMGIIASFNLYEHSLNKNIEMGIEFFKDDDSELYQQILETIVGIGKKSIRISSWDEYTFKPGIGMINDTQNNQTFFQRFVHETIKGGGYCIRCGKPMKFNINRPLCDDCYTIWKKYSRTSYQEKYCHSCREEFPTTYRTPLCNECFMNSTDYY